MLAYLPSVGLRLSGVRGHDSFTDWAKAWTRARGGRAVRVARGRTADAFYRRHLRGGLAFDVGAHRGSHTEAMANRGAHVIAVEPQQAMVDVLTQRGLAGVEVVHAACGPKPGTTTLITASQYDQLATIRADWPETSGDPTEVWDGQEQVAVVTLDSLIDTYGVPNLLKVDAEGFEDGVFAGLSRRVEHVLFEVHDTCPDVAERVFTRLGELGRYHYRLMVEESWNFSRPLTPAQIMSDLPGWGDVYAHRSGRP